MVQVSDRAVLQKQNDHSQPCATLRTFLIELHVLDAWSPTMWQSKKHSPPFILHYSHLILEVYLMCLAVVCGLVLLCVHLRNIGCAWAPGMYLYLPLCTSDLALVWFVIVVIAVLTFCFVFSQVNSTVRQMDLRIPVLSKCIYQWSWWFLVFSYKAHSLLHVMCIQLACHPSLYTNV